MQDACVTCATLTNPFLADEWDGQTNGTNRGTRSFNGAVWDGPFGLQISFGFRTSDFRLPLIWTLMLSSAATSGGAADW